LRKEENRKKRPLKIETAADHKGRKKSDKKLQVATPTWKTMNLHEDRNYGRWKYIL